MASARSPVRQEGVEESEVVEIARPLGMLPHVRPGVQVKPENRELVLDIAENLFPGIYAISDLKKGERESWLILSLNILTENQADLTESIEGIAEVLGPAVQAAIEDTLVKQQFFFEKEERRSAVEEEEREERIAREQATHSEQLVDRAQERRIADERWDLEKKALNKRLAMEVTRHKNASAKERVGIGIAIIGFSVALVLFYIGIKSNQGFVAGGSGAIAATIVGVVLHLLLSEQKLLPPPSGPVSPPAGSPGPESPSG